MLTPPLHCAELHVYNGLFGTHVALIMRRLRRLCHLAGNNHVQFISCSATIASPDKVLAKVQLDSRLGRLTSPRLTM